MTTTISPALGHAPLFTQLGTGTTPGYDAIDDRRCVSVGALQEGVYGASDFMAVQRAAGGAAMFVDIGMPGGGMAVVQGDAVTGQGPYPVPVHSAVITEAIGANASGNPRVDMVVLELKDTIHDASGSNLAQTRVAAGTATAGATLDNRSGAAALPPSALLLADVLVANGAASITNAVIRDRRKWARGAHLTIVRTTGSYTLTTGGAYLDIDSTNLKPRVECSGAPLRVSLRGSVLLPSVAMFFDLYVDGVALSPDMERVVGGAGVSGLPFPVDIEWRFTPAAGSHLIAPRTNSGGTLYATTTRPLTFSIEEILRQDTANNTVTTG